MTDCPDPDPLHTALHELAEGLQATGNYLGALRRRASKGGSVSTDIEVIEHALEQWARAQHAMRELRAQLNALKNNVG